MPRKPAMTVDQKIEKLQAEAERIRARYEAVLENIRQLEDMRDEGKRQELMNALARSKRTYAEIMAFIQSSPEEDEAAT